MNIKQLFFTLLCTLSFVSITGSDEYKEKTKGTDSTPTKLSSEKLATPTQEMEELATIAFMVNTAKPIAEMGDAALEPTYSKWQSTDPFGREYTFVVDNNSRRFDHTTLDAGITLKNYKNPFSTRNTIRNTHYTLEIYAADFMTLLIKSGTLAQHKALFDQAKKKSKVTFDEIISANIKTNDFLEKRYKSHLELCAEQEKSKDK